ATDAAVGAIMARAATHGAGLNVKINGSSLKDRALAEAWAAEADGLIAETEEIARETVAIAAERGGA
ncbi:cyclodeaminase/cyclohydrolase family protein, partial [Promineifilum sp.]|uniref:cyclodeaminase/cyclohydrolase family protein n=1 Tax=Promineifilum sp. TaxID=2664178 RepID=UPI0035B28657